MRGAIAAAAGIEVSTEGDSFLRGLHGAFVELPERSGPFLTPALALGIRDPLETLRERLTPSDFEAGLAAGRARPTDDVLVELARLD